MRALRAPARAYVTVKLTIDASDIRAAIEKHRPAQ